MGVLQKQNIHKKNVKKAQSSTKKDKNDKID
jgi:hypothetical protein